MVWATNWDSSEGKGKLLKPALNDLYNAFLERNDPVGLSTSGLSLISTGDIIPPSWFSTFQSKITNLINRYVNHEESSGNWEGQASIPLWTEASMLTSIGDASRLPAPTDPQLSAPWLYQQYKIINKLRWIDHFGASETLSSSTTDQRIYTGSGSESFASCVTNFNSTSWSSSSGQSTHSSRSTGSTFEIERKRKLYNYNALASYNCDFDHYSGFNAVTVFQDNDYSSTVTTYIIVETGSITASNTYTLTIGDLGNNTTTDPTSDGQHGWIERTPAEGAPVHNGLYKFDVSGGFTYKDW